MSNEEIQSKLGFYIEAFETAKQRIGDAHAASVIVQELAKDCRIESQRNREDRNHLPATDKQLEYLKKLGVEVQPGLTKREASGLIDAALARGGQ